MLLSKKETEVDAKTVDLRTPLWMAAYHGHADTVKLLASRGADLESRLAKYVTKNYQECFVTQCQCQDPGQ